MADFEQVEHLCDPIGQKALQSVVAADPRLLALLQCRESDEGRSITLLLDDATLFEYALAAAYAENRQFPEAVEAAQHALEIADANGITSLAESLRTKLALYQARSPYHETSATQ